MSSRFRGWLPALAAGGVWVAAVWLFVYFNPRLLASWHGFLHTGIAYRFPSPTFTPENPYFAGQPIAYYWFYQALGRGIAAITGTDLLHAFQFISLASLGLLVVVAARLGQRLYGTATAGVLVGYLALAGMNPLGPLIAAAKYVLRSEPMFEHALADDGDTIFVSDAQSDNRMAKPLLGALHIMTDWQSGQDLVWFVDVSSRGAAIALVMVVAALMLRRGSTAAAVSLLAAVGALTAALNPIIGLSTAGCLIAAAVLSLLWRWRSGHPAAARPAEVLRAAAFCAGVVAAWPTYAQLFAFGGTAAMSDMGGFLFKSAAMIAGFLILMPMAVWGCRRAPEESRPALAVITLAGLFLILPVPFVSLYEINEHNFANAAACILAVPAAGVIASTASARVGQLTRAALIVLAFLPTTVGTIVAFAGRPALPLETDGPTLHRLPRDGALEQFYEWARTSTPADAAFVTSPTDTVKMSGNVSEIPAFTRRAIFVDKLTYMTERYHDIDLRTAIAVRATSGVPLAPEELTYLASLQRPLYIATFRATDSAVLDALIAAYGQPVFQRAFVAVFPLASSRSSVARD